jgi:hypothetical protein
MVCFEPQLSHVRLTDKYLSWYQGKLLEDNKENSEDTSYKPPCQQCQLSEESTESYTIGDNSLDIVENSPVQVHS